MTETIKLVAGLDEAGLGPIAGPAFFGIAVLVEGAQLSGVRDSKKLSDEQKYLAACTVMGQAVYYATTSFSVAAIDKNGIGQVWQEGMMRVLSFGLFHYQISRIVVDGNKKIRALGDFPISWWKGMAAAQVEYIVKADDKVPAVSAASVLAKCEQLEFMEYLHSKYPVYGFGGPKGHHGYGVELHAQAIEKYGAVEGVHRHQYAETLAKHRGFELRWRKP